MEDYGEREVFEYLDELREAGGNGVLEMAANLFEKFDMAPEEPLKWIRQWYTLRNQPRRE